MAGAVSDGGGKGLVAEHPSLHLRDRRIVSRPNVVLEALACGTPVIATPAPGGVKEILEGLKGCVLAENISAESLAKALTSFTAGYRVQPDVVAPYSVGSIV